MFYCDPDYLRDFNTAGSSSTEHADPEKSEQPESIAAKRKTKSGK